MFPAIQHPGERGVWVEARAELCTAEHYLFCCVPVCVRSQNIGWHGRIKPRPNTYTISSRLLGTSLEHSRSRCDLTIDLSSGTCKTEIRDSPHTRMRMRQHTREKQHTEHILAQNIPPQPAWGARTHQLSCLAKAAALLCRLARHGATTVLHSRLQATHNDREEEGVVDRRASDVADYERDLRSGRAGADDRCCAHADTRRTSAAHTKRQRGQTGWSSSGMCRTCTCSRADAKRTAAGGESSSTPRRSYNRRVDVLPPVA